MPSSNSSSVTMEEEDKGAAGRGGGGGGRAAQSDLNRIMEKKKTWSELKQACILFYNPERNIY